MDNDMAGQIALHRWAVIAEATSDRLSSAERGALVRGIAGRAHTHPDGSSRRYSRGTIDRWIRAWRAGGLEGLRPSERSDAGTVRAHPELAEDAVALRLELPSRSAAQIASIIFHRHGVTVSERTVRDQLRRKGLHREALEAEPKVFGRYEAGRPNERWITDVLVGPWVPHPKVDTSVRAKLFLVVDDHSRLLVDGVFYAYENARACQEMLRRAIVRRGVPEVLYADNGAPFKNAWLARTCAVLGVRLVHSQPYSPEGRGQAGKTEPLHPRRLLVRGHPSRDRQPRSPQRPVRGVGGGRRQPAYPRRDRPGPDQTLRGRRPAPGRRSRTAARSVPLVSHPQGHPHCHRPPRRKPVCGRPVPGRPARRAAIRPRGSHPHRHLLRRPLGRGGHPVRDRTSHPSGRAPSRPARTRTDRRRLPGPGRRRPRRSGRHRGQSRFHPAGHLRTRDDQEEAR